MKKKIGAITFHSSYNYGSVLQAYALQEFIKNNFGHAYDYQIINLRTERQKKYYDQSFKIFDLKNNLKKILLSRYRTQLLERKNKYEDFINNELCLTDGEYSDMREIAERCPKYDYYISGSDQIWKPTILDFDWSFFLEFVEDDAKRISYAPSFGPEPLLLDDLTRKRLIEDLSKYENISVREVGSAEAVKQVIDKNAEIHVDPTLLLDSGDWDKIVGERIIKEDYILLYDLKGNKHAYEISRELSKIYNIPVVTVKENAKIQFLCRDFVKEYSAGPIEFLNYIKYAKIVVSSSFHGNVFSVIFEKPFLAVDGKTDYRINHLLKMTDLEDRAVSSVEDIPSTNRLFETNFEKARAVIEKERKRSRKYLSVALDEETKK